VSKHGTRRFRLRPKVLARLVITIASVVVATLVAGLATPAAAAPSRVTSPAGTQVSLGSLGNLTVKGADDDSEDVTFTLDLGASFDAARVREVVQEVNRKGSGPGAVFQAETEAVTTVPTYSGSDSWPEFDGTLAVTSTGLSLTVTKPEIHTDAGWLAQILATSAGVLVWVTSRALCLAGMIAIGTPAVTAVAKPVCAFTGTFLGSLTRGGILLAVDGRSLDAKAWAQLIVQGLIAASGSAAWELGINKWAENVLPGLIQELGRSIVQLGQRLGGWFRSFVDAVVRAGNRTSEFAEDVELAAREGAAGATGGQQIAVASYIHPGADKNAWDRLIASDSSKVTFVVANVLNGPGSEKVSSWTNVIGRARASGKKVLGYVATGYLGQTGIRTRLGSTRTQDWVAQIEQDVNAWYALYGNDMGGIFFDEGFNVCGSNDEFPAMYTQVNSYAKRAHPGALTVLNPGTSIPQCYEDTADIMLTYESSYAGYLGKASNPDLNFHELGWKPKSPTKIWHIIYDVPADAVASIAATSRERDAGYIQITDDIMPNPYDTLPNDAYWKAEEAAVPGGTPAIAPAPYDSSGGGAPSVPGGLRVESSDYTSAQLSWSGVGGASSYVVRLDGAVVASLPAAMTSTTIGGLAPGGKTYRLTVSAQSGSGLESAASNTVSVTTLSLPGGKTVANQKVTDNGSTVTYSADFLVPYSFHRVFIEPKAPDATCWWMASDNADIGGSFCGHWVIENSNLLSYAGKSAGEWSWNPIAGITPTLNGYTYSWTVNAADVAGSTDFIAFQGEGYGPLTNVYTPGCAPAILICINPINP
jgi:hypothetical protein